MANNSTTKSNGQQRSVQLSTAKLTAIQRWRQQPDLSYSDLRPATIPQMIAADSPTLWDIRAKTDHATAVGLLVLALIHTAKLVNVENNLNETQIGEIANDVLDDMGYLKMEEVKYILKNAIRTKKIFGRLDYNVVMEWFEEYDRERTEEAIRVSDRQAEIAQMEKPSADGISFEQYKEQLKQRAADGDTQAARWLASIERPAAKALSRDRRDKDRDDFRRFKAELLRHKHNDNNPRS